MAATCALVATVQGCDGCDPAVPGKGDAAVGDAQGADRLGTDTTGSNLDGSADRVLADGAASDGDPLVQPLPDFCSGTGTVVSIGSEGICAGDLAADTFRFALCACQSISVQGQLVLDAYDSSLGAYGGSNVVDDGQLGLNQGDLVFDSQLSVRGSVFSGGGGVVFGPGSSVTQNLYAYGNVGMYGTGSHAEINRNAFVNGDVANRITIGGDLTVPASATVSATVNGTIVQAPVPQILPCPCAANQILDIAGLTTWAATHNDNDAYAVEDAGGGGDAGFRLDPALYETGGPAVLRLPCGRFYLTRIDQGESSLDIVVADRTVLFVGGDLLAHRFSITVDNGGELDLFVAGDLVIGAAADFGAPDKPSSVRTYVAGNLSFQASSTFAGNVYAPNADIVFGANASLYGSLMVRSVTFEAAADIHFDTAIRRAGESCEEPVTDGGVVTTDGGVVTADGGGGDAGAGGCTLCGFECGWLACLIEPGHSTGVCGECRTDLDCCAPLLCDTATGNCFYPGG
ncbi:MAG: hypothetical protein JXR83_09315 [Deltaproteobacteria bacterium]|nr:hypothetical protein [Deltaproteobacteria bacterium]